MSSPRWLRVLACLIAFAAGLAAAADPPQAQEGQAVETVSGAPAAGPGTPAAGADPETAAPETQAAATPVQTADPNDPELAGARSDTSNSATSEGGPDAPDAGAQGVPPTQPVNPPARVAKAGTQVMSPVLPRSKGTPAMKEQPAPAETKATAPKGAVPSAEESLKLGEALDDMLLFPEPYYYESLGRRDIFVSLIPEEEEVDPNLRSEDLTVVGILWAERDRFALVEAPDGRCMILREGAALGDGTVIRILPDRIIVHVTEYGTSRNVSLPLAEGGITDENPRSPKR